MQELTNAVCPQFIQGGCTRMIENKQTKNKTGGFYSMSPET